jgi:hypothetical protein
MATEIGMSLSQAMHASRRLVRRNVREPAILNIENVARHALFQTRLPLLRKNQVGKVACEQNVTLARMALEPFLITMQDAILEISSLSARESVILISCKNNLLRISGSNPIDVPETALVADSNFTMQAYLQRIRATLRWEPGFGPALSLELPTAEFKPPLSLTSQPQPAGRAGLLGGGEGPGA